MRKPERVFFFRCGSSRQMLNEGDDVNKRDSDDRTHVTPQQHPCRSRRTSERMKRIYIPSSMILSYLWCAGNEPECINASAISMHHQ